MKTILELPDELMRRVKMHALQRSQKLEDAVAQLLEAGIAAEPQADVPPRAPKPVRLRKHGPLTIDDIEAAIASGRRAGAHAVADRSAGSLNRKRDLSWPYRMHRQSPR